MTGTPFCILPVFRFNDTAVGNGGFGKRTREILDKWSENVNVNIIDQIKKFEEECKKFNKINTTTPYQFSSEI